MPVDRLSHPFPGACSSTHPTTYFYRRSRPRTIRPPRRLPRRVLGRYKTHHRPSHLRRHLRATHRHAWSPRRPSPPRTPSLPRTAPQCHRLRLLFCRDGACPVSPPGTWRQRSANFLNSVPLALSGYSMLCFLLTDPIYGSTLSIPENFWLTSLEGGCDRKPRGETQSRGDFASSPFTGDHPSEVDGKAEWNQAVASPGLVLPDSPRGNSSPESERIQRGRTPFV